MIREAQFLIDDGILDLFLVSWVKWWKTGDQFVQKCSQGVKIDTKGMPTLQDHFRWHVFGTSTKGVSNLSGVHSTFGEPKVRNLDMSIMVDQQVFRLQIPINDILLMQVHESIHDLNEVKPCVLFAHSLDWLKVVEKLSPGTVIQNETYEIVGLKTVI